MPDYAGFIDPFESVWNLFNHRVTSPARAKSDLPYRILDPFTRSSEIHSLLSSDPLSDERVLYIHLPFCDQNCTFCGYYKEVGCNKDLIDRYIVKTTDHLKRLASFAWVKGKPFQAVYLGGGSPSSLSLPNVTSLMTAIRKYIPLGSEAEITMELTVHDCSQALLNHLVKQGINRISIGVQTFDTHIRRNLGRNSSKEEVCRAIIRCSEAGFTNICTDLIYNLPGQTVNLFESDLQTLGTLPVTGCSVYPLIPFPDSSLVSSGRFPLITAEQDFAFFKLADDYLLSGNDWMAYSPVQYGHVGSGRPGYILAQGKQSDLLALGPSAGGRINQYRYLSGYDLKTCLSDDFDFLANSAWSSINPEFLKYRHLYSLSEGNGISTQMLANADLQITDLVPGATASGLILASPDNYRLSQNGRYWAGNISQIISRNLIKILTN